MGPAIQRAFLRDHRLQLVGGERLLPAELHKQTGCHRRIAFFFQSVWRIAGAKLNAGRVALATPLAHFFVANLCSTSLRLSASPRKPSALRRQIGSALHALLVFLKSFRRSSLHRMQRGGLQSNDLLILSNSIVSAMRRDDGIFCRIAKVLSRKLERLGKSES